jgi:hypothetical protein
MSWMKHQLYCMDFVNIWDAQSPILILCLDQKKYIDRQKIEAQGTN